MSEPLIKKRKFVLVGTEDSGNRNKIKEHLMKQKGVIGVDIDWPKGTVRIEYDLLRINFETIEILMKQLGFSLSQKVKEKFKRGMIKFTEQNELDNLSASPSSCCSDPKDAACRSKSSNY